LNFKIEEVNVSSTIIVGYYMDICIKSGTLQSFSFYCQTLKLEKNSYHVCGYVWMNIF